MVRREGYSAEWRGAVGSPRYLSLSEIHSFSFRTLRAGGGEAERHGGGLIGTRGMARAGREQRERERERERGY